MRPPPRAAAGAIAACRGTARGGSSRARRPTPPASISNRSRTTVRAAQLTSAHGSPAAPSARAAASQASALAHVERDGRAPVELRADDRVAVGSQPLATAPSRARRRAEPAAGAGDERDRHGRAGSRRSRRRGRRARPAGTPAARGRTCARLAAFSIRVEPVAAEPLAEAAADHDAPRRRAASRPSRSPTPSACTASLEQVARDLVARLERPQPDAARQRVAPALLLQLEEDRLALPRPRAARAPRAPPGRRTPRRSPRRPQLQRRPPGFDAHVPDLARGAAARGRTRPSSDEPAADAGAPEDAEERPHAAPRAEPPLGLDGDVDVVAEHDRARRAAAATAGRERERLVPARRCSATWSTMPASRRRCCPARRCPRRRAPSDPTPASSSRRLAHRLGDVARRPPPGRRRAACPAAPRRATFAARAGDDGLDLRARRDRRRRAARAHASRRTTSSSGRRFARALHSAAVRDSGSRGARGQAEREDDRRRLVLARARARRARRPRRRARSGTTRCPRSRRRAACSAPRGPRRTRPAPCPCTTIATTSPAPRTLSGSNTVAASASTRARRRRAGRTSTAAGSTPSRRAGRHRGCVRRRRRAAARAVATLVAAARDRQERVHASSLIAAR